MNIWRAHPIQAMVDLYLILQKFPARIFPKSQDSSVKFRENGKIIPGGSRFKG